jgi:hypothetical protein
MFNDFSLIIGDSTPNALQSEEASPVNFKSQNTSCIISTPESYLKLKAVFYMTAF